MLLSTVYNKNQGKREPQKSVYYINVQVYMYYYIADQWRILWGG